MINIAELPKHEVLAALFNASKQQGYGLLDSSGARPMTATDAMQYQAQLPAGSIFNYDYVKGRVLKVDITGDAFDERLFDRDNGDGAAAKAIAELRKRLGVTA